MNKIKRFLKKDKYGIVLGCAVQCLLLVLFMLVLILALKSRVDVFRAADASAAVQRISVQLGQYIDDSMQHMESMAHQLDDGLVGREDALVMLSGEARLSDVRIEHADGIMSRIIPQPNGALQLRTPLASGEELAAKLSVDAVRNILSGALPGEYDYTLYNINTGACLFSSNSLSASSFYDVLMNLSERGKVYRMIEHSDISTRVMRAEMENGVYYIALTENEDNGCGVAVALPEALLMHDRTSMLPVLLALFVPMALLIACALIFAARSLRRIRNSNRNIARALDMSDRQVSAAARDARITILVIGYGHEGVLACHDGLGLTTSTTQIHSLSDLEGVCGMADGEMDRMYECMSRLAADKTSAVTVRCFTASQEDRSLRITFRLAEADGRNILCSISDCTHELAAQNRVEQEQSYFANAKRRTSAVWQVNVSRNRWRALQISKSDPLYELAHVTSSWRDYSADMGGVVSEFIHPADYFDFANRLSVPSLASAFRSGMTEMTLEHRIGMPKTRQYAWHRLHARLWTDPITNDILANFYLYNVDAKKNAELERGERKRVLQQSLMALSGIYAGLYYVDLDNDLCYTARSRGGELADQLSAPYKATFDRYIDTVVHADDREKLRGMLSAYLIKRSMTEGSHFRRCEYRSKLDDDSYERMVIIIQPARFENGTIKEIVLAIRDLENENL